MNIVEKIRFALRRVLRRNVRVFPSEDWRASVRSDGSVTYVVDGVAPLMGVDSDRRAVYWIASGQTIASPGVDLAREDLRDYPDIYNVDHYDVIEDITIHDKFSRVATMAGLDNTAAEREQLREVVFVVGPAPARTTREHHSSVLPERFRRAKLVE